MDNNTKFPQIEPIDSGLEKYIEYIDISVKYQYRCRFVALYYFNNNELIDIYDATYVAEQHMFNFLYPPLMKYYYDIFQTPNNLHCINVNLNKFSKDIKINKMLKLFIYEEMDEKSITNCDKKRILILK